MLKHPVIVFNKGYARKFYFTFSKGGVWCTTHFLDAHLYMPKEIGNVINNMLECAYEEGEEDGQFETDELHSENRDFARGRNPMA